VLKTDDNKTKERRKSLEMVAAAVHLHWQQPLKECLTKPRDSKTTVGIIWRRSGAPLHEP
jgi:hypothetical protein